MKLEVHSMKTASWNLKKSRATLSRGVSFLARTFSWLTNTIRRLINTLSTLGIVRYEFRDKAVTFLSVTAIDILKGFVSVLSQSLKCTLVKTKQSQAAEVLTRASEPQVTNKPRRSFKPSSPSEAAAYLNSLK